MDQDTSMTKQLQMVDLIGQYERLKDEIDTSMKEVLRSARFIKGPVVQKFEEELADYLSIKHVIACGNGTDALQIALMAFDLKPGDEVIVPAFTYVATAEVIGLLGLRPIMIDVDRETFNISPEYIESFITSKTKAIVPVHLYGQCCDMEKVMELAERHDLYVVEDSAQSIGGKTLYQGDWKSSGGIGHIGCTSFFPSKNLGCYGDGGAIFTNDDLLAQKIRMIANHGQSKKYYHALIGVNSRLDALQAAVLRVKLRYLDSFCETRNGVADRYDQAFKIHDAISTPVRVNYSTHVFHQYTIKVAAESRDSLKSFLAGKGIPSMIYYPLPLYRQEAYATFYDKGPMANTEELCASVLSLPIHTEMKAEDQDYIIDSVLSFFE